MRRFWGEKCLSTLIGYQIQVVIMCRFSRLARSADMTQCIWSISIVCLNIINLSFNPNRLTYRIQSSRHIVVAIKAEIDIRDGILRAILRLSKAILLMTRFASTLQDNRAILEGDERRLGKSSHLTHDSHFRHMKKLFLYVKRLLTLGTELIIKNRNKFSNQRVKVKKMEHLLMSCEVFSELLSEAFT